VKSSSWVRAESYAALGRLGRRKKGSFVGWGIIVKRRQRAGGETSEKKTIKGWGRYRRHPLTLALAEVITSGVGSKEAILS